MSTYTPEGYHTINPFIITRDAARFIGFLEQVFGAVEMAEARTVDTDGLLLHAEVKIGNSMVLLGETKPDWPFTPSLLQIYVDDVEKTLQRAEELGAKVVTRPSAVLGFLFSRIVDPWNNLWWVYQHQGGVSWEESAGAEGDSAWDTQSSELHYIHETLLEAMQQLGKK